LKKKVVVYLFLFLGLAILGWLIYSMDWEVLKSSFSMVGYKIFIVFATAFIWVVCNTLCLKTLIAPAIPFHQLLFTQITGDAYNAVTPFGGLGGVPVKINHLTNWVSVHEASEAIVRDQLVHTVSGMMYTTVLSFLAVAFLPLEQAYLIPFLIVGIVFCILSVLMTLLIFSSKPSKLLSKLLKKVKIVSDYRSNPLDKKTFLQALGFKMTGRVMGLLELWVIFVILGFSPSLVDIVTVMTMLTVSSSIMFIFPQGIGVHEASITGAFKILGYSTTLGLSFGLIRRARTIFWVLLGVALHLMLVFFMKNKEGAESIGKEAKGVELKN